MPKTQLECIVFRTKPRIEFLLLKRIPEKGGFWQPVCGGLEPEDASLIDGAYRELEEETTVTRSDVLAVFENVHTFVMDKHYLTGEPIDPVTEYVFAFEVDPEVTISIDSNIYPEHDEFRWVSFDEAMKLLKWENNKEAFRKLKDLLS
jgi:dihydroneopterin triphosphate diphosphatase